MPKQTSMELAEGCKTGVQSTEFASIDLVSDEKQLRAKLIAQSPIADINILGINISCILDTGAETSLISSEFYHKHLADKVDGLGTVGTFIRLVGANDLEIPIAGYLEIPIEIFSFSIRASFLVRSDAPSEPLSKRRVKFLVLLGCNILRAIASIGVVPVGPCRDDWNVALQWFKCRDKQDQCTHRPFKPTRGDVGEVCLVQEETIIFSFFG